MKIPPFATRGTGARLPAMVALLLILAQNPQRGTVRGVVKGPDDQPLAGVRVVATRPGASIIDHTGPDGAYELSMRPRHYELRAELPGLCGGAPRQLDLTAGPLVRVDIRLRLAPVEYVQRVDYPLRETFERTAAVVHLRIARSHPPRLLVPDVSCGDGNILTEHEADVITEVKIDAASWPKARRIRFIQRRAGTYTDGTTTVRGSEEPYVIGEEYVAFLTRSNEDAYLEPHWSPDYMIPVSTGAVEWAGRRPIDGVPEGMPLQRLLDLLQGLADVRRDGEPRPR